MGATITTLVPDDIEKKIENISRIEHLNKSAVGTELDQNPHPLPALISPINPELTFL